MLSAKCAILTKSPIQEIIAHFSIIGEVNDLDAMLWYKNLVLLLSSCDLYNSLPLSLEDLVQPLHQCSHMHREVLRLPILLHSPGSGR